MIVTANIRTLNPADYDEVWYIVRQLKQPSARALHVPELSPSRELFVDARRLISTYQFTEQAFREMYVPRMLRELHAPEARTKLNELCRRSKNGERIAIACYCPVERLCHRSIVAGLLQGAGAEIETEWGRDYSDYYHEYRKINDFEQKGRTICRHEN